MERHELPRSSQSYGHSDHCGMKFASPNCYTASVNWGVQTGAQSLAECYVPVLKTGHSCIFDTVFASVILNIIYA